MKKDFHIGEMIRLEVKRQGISVDRFGEMIHCARANVYNIFHRDNIDVMLLAIISKALKRNFVMECAQNVIL